MTRGDWLQITAALPLVAGVFVLFGLGWALIALVAGLFWAGEVVDGWRKATK